MNDDAESVARLNAVGILTRREIEARILAPVLDALGREFGRDRVVEVAREAIAGIARDQGRAMAADGGDTSLTGFFERWEPWTRAGSLELRLIEANDERLAFDVMRCRYAEMYRAPRHSRTRRGAVVPARRGAHRRLRARRHAHAHRHADAGRRVLRLPLHPAGLTREMPSGPTD